MPLNQIDAVKREVDAKSRRFFLSQGAYYMRKATELTRDTE